MKYRKTAMQKEAENRTRALAKGWAPYRTQWAVRHGRGRLLSAHTRRDLAEKARTGYAKREYFMIDMRLQHRMYSQEWHEIGNCPDCWPTPTKLEV